MSHEFHGLAIRCTHLPLTHTAYLFVYSEPKLNINDTYFEVIEHQIDSLFVRFSTDGYPDPIYSKRFDWLVVAMYSKLGMYIRLWLIGTSEDSRIFRINRSHLHAFV